DDAYEVKNTTPDALHLQRNFHKMVREQVDIVMMEVSSHALDLGRVYGSDFDIAVFTNLSQDHLDYHKDMEDYLRAKTLLFRSEDAYEVKKTTPDALHLQRNFHKMVREQVDIVMMEVSSHALDLGRVYGSDFDIAVFTNLSQDHLDYHKDMEDYLRAKTLLFTSLGNTYKE